MEESEHRLHIAVADPSGRLVAAAGDPHRVTFFRSAAKPFQALPLLESGASEAFGLEPRHLALCTGSHSGEPVHLTGIREILARVDAAEEELECGPAPPLGEAAARALAEGGAWPRRIHNNCSGKHAGMLALARHSGWGTAGYRRAGHPVQRAMLREIARWTGLAEAEVGTATDGCGVVTFALPLRAMARAFAALGRAAGEGAEGPAEVVDAMTAHPFEVAGSGRLCTVLMEALGGRIFAKVGAEGIYCAGIPERGLGLALKVEDGGRRAADPALVRLLEVLEVEGAEEDHALEPFRRPPVRNTLGEEVGFLFVELSLWRDNAPLRGPA